MNKLNKYDVEVKQKWQKTIAYQEHKEKTKNYSIEKWNTLTLEMNSIFLEFSKHKRNNTSINSLEVVNLVKKLQNHITTNYYNCTKEILLSLGHMYVSDDRFKNNIDKYEKGTSLYVFNAIKFYCNQN